MIIIVLSQNEVSELEVALGQVFVIDFSSGVVAKDLVTLCYSCI